MCADPSVGRASPTRILMAVVFPATGEAGIRGDLGDVSSDVGLLERLSQLWSWAESVLTDLGAQFGTKEGASITGGG